MRSAARRCLTGRWWCPAALRRSAREVLVEGSQRGLDRCVVTALALFGVDRLTEGAIELGLLAAFFDLGDLGLALLCNLSRLGLRLEGGFLGLVHDPHVV